MKSPIPTETAILSVAGMELNIASRTLVIESMMNMIPSTNTAVSAISQESPMPIQTV